MVRSVFINGRWRSVVTTREYRLGVRPANAGKKFPAEIYTRRQIHRLMAHLGVGNCGARNRALVVVMWRSGLRVKEAVDLYPADVDLQAGRITVRQGKGGKRRLVGIDPEAGAVIADWIHRRRALGLTGHQPLFCVISQPTIGKAMYTSCVREALKDASKRAGLTDEGVSVRPHCLRHTFASELVRERVPVNLIRLLLGHSDLRTTDRYLHELPGEAVDTLRERRWQPLTHSDLLEVDAGELTIPAAA